MNELPIARVAEMIQRVNTSSEDQEKIKLSNLLFYHKIESSDLSPAAAWVAIELKRQKKLPDEFLGAWTEIEKRANLNNRKVEIRAFKSKCGNFWILAPEFKGNRIYGLALVKNFLNGTIGIFDMDRHLYSINIKIPRRTDFCYIEDTSFEVVERERISTQAYAAGAKAEGFIQ